jgi:CubicO group peptidase (beta-lactamase class C family)
MSSNVVASVEGTVAPGFEGVREVFERNFAEKGEIGASFCVYRGEDVVVDLWGGEDGRGGPWTSSTVAPVFSVSKGIAAMVMQVLCDEGALDLDAPVADVWPEFAAAGKEQVTLRMVLAHTAGLPWFEGQHDVVSFDSVEGWASRDHIEDRIAAQAPYWEPGTKVGYHSFTYGWMVDAIARRATGRTIGEVLAQRLAGPLGADVFINYRHDPGRVATLAAPTQISEERDLSNDDSGLANRTFFIGPQGRPMWEVAGTPAYWALGGPAAGGLANGRGIATLYSLLVSGGSHAGRSYFSPESIAEHTREQFAGIDVTFGFESRPALGYALTTTDGVNFGPGPNTVGFSGMGGSVGFADLDAGLSFGYTMNQLRLESYGNVSTAAALVDAVYAASAG